MQNHLSNLTKLIKIKKNVYGKKRRRNETGEKIIIIIINSIFFCSASCFCSAFHTFSMFRRLPVCHPFLFRNFKAINQSIDLSHSRQFCVGFDTQRKEAEETGKFTKIFMYLGPNQMGSWDPT